jgi:tRNA threonylcarbamoyladenosine biosynthesis protein TsaE
MADRPAPEFTYDAPDETATAALGAALAEVLPPGTTVALCGTLGAGKTRLVQAIAEASGVDRRQVVSPTFVLIQEYRGRRPLYHIDVYRLRDDAEFMDLGPDEYFESDGLVLVEWADRVQDLLPRDRVEIHIQVTGERSRRFEITARGERYAELAGRLSAALSPFPSGSDHRRRARG